MMRSQLIKLDMQNTLEFKRARAKSGFFALLSLSIQMGCVGVGSGSVPSPSSANLTAVEQALAGGGTAALPNFSRSAQLSTFLSLPAGCGRLSFLPNLTYDNLYATTPRR